MALGGFFGAFANMIGGLAASSQQREDNEYLMNKQAELNKEQADYSTDLAKNYWNYTNYDNQGQTHEGSRVKSCIILCKRRARGINWRRTGTRCRTTVNDAYNGKNPSARKWESTLTL